MSADEFLIISILTFCIFPLWVSMVVKMASIGWHMGIYESNKKIKKEIEKDGKKE